MARITVGPWLHGDPGELKIITQQDIAWLDHHPGGGLPPGAPVRVLLQVASTWLDFEEWPPPAAVGMAYYLRVSDAPIPEQRPRPRRPAPVAGSCGDGIVQ
jgi:hypothetical protein